MIKVELYEYVKPCPFGKTTKIAQLAQFCSYQKMLENRPVLEFKNNDTSLSDIFQSAQNWANYSVFVDIYAARIMLGPIVMLSKKGASFKLIPANVIPQPTT